MAILLKCSAKIRNLAGFFFSKFRKNNTTNNSTVQIYFMPAYWQTVKNYKQQNEPSYNKEIWPWLMHSVPIFLCYDKWISVSTLIFAESRPGNVLTLGNSKKKD